MTPFFYFCYNLGLAYFFHRCRTDNGISRRCHRRRTLYLFHSFASRSSNGILFAALVLFGGVFLSVKMHKQYKQRHHFEYLCRVTQIMLPRGIVSPRYLEEAKCGIDDDRSELQQLCLRKMCLPRTCNFTQTECIIRIHHHMNQRVQKGSKVRVTTRPDGNSDPPAPCNRCMMVHVKERYLIHSPAQYHKIGIKEFEVLVAIMNPHSERGGGRV